MIPVRLLIILLATLFFGTASAQQLTIGTYNIRFDNPKDSGNLWVQRAPVVAALIRFHNFDILGTQEAYKTQLDTLNAALPYYNRFGAGRDDGKEKGEHSAIFYKKDLFELLKGGNFWLSQTPDTPSLGWDATCCKRICSWVYLKHKKSGKKFFVFNAHYDHQGMQARKESSLLILKKITEIAGSQPVLFTGDLNGSHSSDPYLSIQASGWLKDTYRLVKYPYANNGSFNAFNAAGIRNDIIDHIFSTVHFTVNRWGLLTDTYGGRFPSDHFPVLAEVTFN